MAQPFVDARPSGINNAAACASQLVGVAIAARLGTIARRYEVGLKLPPSLRLWPLQWLHSWRQQFPSNTLHTAGDYSPCPERSCVPLTDTSAYVPTNSRLDTLCRAIAMQIVRNASKNAEPELIRTPDLRIHRVVRAVERYRNSCSGAPRRKNDDVLPTPDHQSKQRSCP